MPTSMLLFKESGEPIHDAHSQFRLVESEHGSYEEFRVLHELVVEGDVLPVGETVFSHFIQKIEAPYDLRTDNRLFLNADCAYDEKLLELIRYHFGGVRRTPVTPTRVTSAQIEGLGVGVDAAMRERFSRGFPICVLNALSADPGRGDKGSSQVTVALRSAIRAWSVIAGQTARHAFERTERMGAHAWPDENARSRQAEDIIGCALGYRPGGTTFDIGVPAMEISRLALEAFQLKSLIDNARRSDFAPMAANDEERKGFSYSNSPREITGELWRNINELERLFPDLRFDGFAIAAWAGAILVKLRIAYSMMVIVDRQRAEVRDRLVDASALSQQQYVADQFTFAPYLGLPARRNGGARARVRLQDLLGPDDAVLIAFLAGLDPRVVHTDLCAFERETQDCLFGSARLLGALYRQRRVSMTAAEALWLVSMFEKDAAFVQDNDLRDGRGDNDATELAIAFGTICSFLTPLGRQRIEAAAREAVADGLPREILATEPELLQFEEGLARAEHARQLRDLNPVPQPLPAPIFVPATRLLLPGDYMAKWVDQNSDLLESL